MADKILKFEQVDELLTPAKTYINQETAKRVSTEASQGLDDTKKKNARDNIDACNAASLTCTIPVDGWVDDKISVTCTGVTASDNLIVSPAPTSLTEYGKCGIYCSAQAADTLTFTRSSTTTAALNVNILRIN